MNKRDIRQGKENERLSRALAKIIPAKQWDEVYNHGMQSADIDGTFLGFLTIYKRISEIIPLHFTVIDFGCAENAQSYYFMGHKRFIAVDFFPDLKPFIATGTEFYHISIAEYIKTNLEKHNLDETFAICSYVPPWGIDNIKLVRESFKNVFTYYPHGGI